MAETTTPAAPAAAPAQNAAMEASTTQPVPKAEGAEAKKPAISWHWFIILGAVWLWFLYSMKKNKKRQQQQKEEMNNLDKGDRVVTIGRVHGVVTKCDEKTFTIKPDNNKDFTMTFDREALLRNESKSEASAEEAK